jgi:hypothetical protein
VSVIVLVHGFDPTGRGYSCDHYWGDAERAFRRWDPSVEVVTVGSVRGDHDCDMTIGRGGPNTPIETIGSLPPPCIKRTRRRGYRSRWSGTPWEASLSDRRLRLPARRVGHPSSWCRMR